MGVSEERLETTERLNMKTEQLCPKSKAKIKWKFLIPPGLKPHPLGNPVCSKLPH
jgi:hypothetical protein